MCLFVKKGNKVSWMTTSVGSTFIFTVLEQRTRFVRANVLANISFVFH